MEVPLWFALAAIGYLGCKLIRPPRSFPDKQKRKAEAWLSNIEADMSQGRYIDPAAGSVTFGQYGMDGGAHHRSRDPRER
ncbi:hypothetical protein [Streptomyces avermitilis]|uniref:hypothetical protein n=1 Tax=Streptomyces avermitilis TaxID=33903 RepID=UPI0036BE603A